MRSQLRCGKFFLAANSGTRVAYAWW